MKGSAGYPGWWSLAAGFVCSLIVVGGVIYSFGLYVVPFSEAYGLSRAEANLGMIVLNAGIMTWSPLVGRLLDRYDAARVVAFGGIMFALGLVVLARVEQTGWIAAALGGPLALAIVCAGPLAASTVAARWFRRRRGRAMGLTAVSTAAGGFVMTQVGAYLITDFGWRSALMITGLGGGGVILLLALLFVRSGPPTEEQLRAGGEWIEEDSLGVEATDGREWTARELVRSPAFWLIGLGGGLLMGSDQALVISKIPYLLDIGIGLQAASFLIACQSASASVGKLGIGFAADRVALQRLFLLVALAHLFVLAALILQPGYGTLLAVFVVAGVAVGGVHPVLTMLIAASFGARSYASAYGLMNTLLQVLAMVAVYSIGWVYDETGSYEAAFWGFGVVVFASILLIGRVRLPGDVDEPPGTGRAERSRS